jgi:hypothetical protein
MVSRAHRSLKPARNPIAPSGFVQVSELGVHVEDREVDVLHQPEHGDAGRDDHQQADQHPEHVLADGPPLAGTPVEGRQPLPRALRQPARLAR